MILGLALNSFYGPKENVQFFLIQLVSIFQESKIKFFVLNQRHI